MEPTSLWKLAPSLRVRRIKVITRCPSPLPDTRPLRGGGAMHLRRYFMKTLVFAILAALFISGEVVAKDKRVYKKHYVSYVEGEPYYRVYYVGEDRRPYYRRIYYEDEPEYVTYRTSARRYYYHPRHDEVSVRSEEHTSELQSLT